MREIKFRVWDPRYKEMVPPEGEGFTLGDFAMGLYPIGLCNESSFRGDLVLMQYTGLKDMKGEEIYEGDIIEIDYYGDKTNYTVIGPRSDYPAFELYPVLCDDCNSLSYLTCSNDSGEYYVIGNIYENPELLETE